LLERGQRFFRPALLHNTQDRIQHHDQQDRAGLDPITKQDRHDRRHDQQNDDEVVELG
jgi:hypothetical protein